jgi:hypothetical protein
VRTEDDVVHGEQRVGGAGRLGLEHVQSGAADAAGAQGVDQCRLVHDRSAGDVEEHGRGLHQGQSPGVHEVVGLLGQHAHHDHRVGLGHHGVGVAETHAEFAGRVRRTVGVVGDDLGVERPQQTDQVAGGVAQAEQADPAAGEPEPHPLLALGPASLTHQPVLGGDVVQDGQQHGEGGGGDRASGAVGCDGDQGAVARAGVEVDGVVADAEAGEEKRRPRDALERAGGDGGAGEQDGVQAVDVRGEEFAGVTREVVPGDPGGVQLAEPDVAPHVASVRVAEVTADPDGEPALGRLGARHHSTATGLTGEPVPPGTFSGATTSRNS